MWWRLGLVLLALLLCAPGPVYLPLITKNYAPPPELDAAEVEFAALTDYPEAAQMQYLDNGLVRVGISPSYGGTIFWLSGADGHNRIMEHGGAAVQLSLWGYPAALNQACSQWQASMVPTNPIMAQAANCGWDGPTNDVDRWYWAGDELVMERGAPNQFTTDPSLPGLRWLVGVRLPPGSRWAELHYRVDWYNPGVNLSVHNQELPAIFADSRIADHYYYQDEAGQVQRVPAGEYAELYLPGREVRPLPVPATVYQSGGNWLTVCNADDSQCLSVSADATEVSALVMSGNYITALGRFALGTEYHGDWWVRVSPYKEFE